MKNKHWILLLIIWLIPWTSNAQYDSRIQGSVSNIFSPSFTNNGFSIPIKSIGGSIQHSVYKGLGIKGGYQLWFDPASSSIGGEPFEVTMIDKGYGTERWDYQIFDIGPHYSRFYKRHEFFGHLGFSFAKGKNYVITHIYQQPGFPDKLEFGEIRKVNYSGIKYELGYNYMLFKNRMNAGVSISSRNYFGRDAFTQYNLNVNFGYNFNLVKKERKEES